MGRYGSRDYCQGAYYHIYNRGNNKQKIFLERNDYIFYLKKLREFKEKHNISIFSYCLMPNHLHLGARQDAETPISKFILSLHTSYSMFFNKKYSKVGHLFQGRFGCKIVDKDEYLFYLSSYIHLNPLIDGLVEKTEDYPWSSYPDYIGLRKGTLCDKSLAMAGITPEQYQRVVEEEVEEKLKEEEFQKLLDEFGENNEGSPRF